MNDIIKEIRSIAGSIYNRQIHEAQKKGRKVIGYFCSYIPEEIIHAAGFIPYRIKTSGAGRTPKGDLYFSPINCSFVRHCFDNILNDEYSFLDGAVIMNACDNIRRIYDNWRDAKKKFNLKPDFLYFFFVPHLIGNDALDVYMDEIIKFRKAIEEAFIVTITDEALMDSIKLYNRRRRLLSSIYEKRKRAAVPIKGSDVLSIMLAITSLPVEAGNEFLEEIDDHIKKESVSCNNDNHIRVLIAGGCLEDIEYLELIEECGISIVADNLCFGSRYFNLMVDESGDPIESIAKRYLNKLSCPRMTNCFTLRAKSMINAVKEYNADAVIMDRLKFCNLWGVENVIIKKEAVRVGIPFLSLERELYDGGTGQIKTRVQAFIEKVNIMLRNF